MGNFKRELISFLQFVLKIAFRILDFYLYENVSRVQKEFDLFII